MILTPAQRKYTYYLNSIHWRHLRKRILIRDGFRCHDCQGHDQLNVHHLTYDRLGNELDEDLITLCRSCHESRHSGGPIKLSDWKRVRNEAPVFLDGVQYTERELELMTEKILLDDLECRAANEDPVILLEPHLKARSRTEIYTHGQTPDPAVVSGLYWRTHPRGRGWTSRIERKDVDYSFYHGTIDGMLRRWAADNVKWEPEPFIPNKELRSYKTTPHAGRSWTDDDLIQAVAQSQKLTQVLVRLGLSVHGHSRKRVRERMSALGLVFD